MTAEASGEFLEDLGAETAKLKVRTYWADSTATWVSGRTEAWGEGATVGSQPPTEVSGTEGRGWATGKI